MSIQAIGATLRLEHVQKCRICGKGVMHTGLPMCWRVTIERMGFDVAAIHHAAGLEMMVGPQLASVMDGGGPLADPIGDADQVLLCEECAVSGALPIAALAIED